MISDVTGAYIENARGAFVQRSLWLVAFLFLLLCHQANGAQLIDKLPTKLEQNWQVCSLFESRPANCEQQSLPLSEQSSIYPPKYQIFTASFILNSQLKNTTLGLFIADLDDVDEVYINNRLIGKTGRFLPDFESGFRYPRLYLIPDEFVHFNQFNKIEIKTFSSRNLPGIQTDAPVIGNYLEFQHQIQKHDHFFIIAATIMLLLTIFQLFYFIVVKDNNETLYCTMYLIGFAIVSLARSQVPIESGLDLSSVFKLELIMLSFGMISLTLFILKFFELELRIFHSIGLFILGASGLLAIVWPYAIDLRKIAEVNYWLIVLLSVLVAGHALLLANHKGRKYAKLISITMIVTWLLFIYDAAMQSIGLLKIVLPMHREIMPISNAIVGIIFSLTITHKYWQFFKGSTYDHLTGTLLRPAFFQRLSEEMQRCRRGNNQLLVAIIDIQQAKKISINYGYNVGSHMLSTVSSSLTKVLRPFDLICRFNDEQFCIAASISSRQDAESCLKRVYQELINIKHPIDHDIELYIDTRVGGVIFNEELHMTVSHLLQDVGYALSKAKSQSRHNYLLTQSPMIEEK